MAYKHRSDSLEFSRKHYSENRQYYLDKAKRNKEQQRAALRKIIREAKDVPCKDCGNSYPYYVMHFDHLGDKDFNIADGIGQGITVKKLLDEIKKCDVICANCHAIRTHERRQIQQEEEQRTSLQMEFEIAS